MAAGGQGKQRVSAAPMWILGLVIMIDSTDQSIVRGVIPQIKSSFHVGDLAIGVLMSAFVAVNGLVTVPAGYLADRWHRARTIGHTIVGWSGITALTALSPNFPVMLGIRALLGFGQGITEPSAGSLLADLYPAERRGRAFSIQQCLAFVGFGLGVGLGGLVGTRMGWRYAFLLVGAPGTLIAFACYRLREPKRGYSDRMHLGLAGEEDAEADAATDLLADGWWAFLRDMVSGLRADLRTILSIPTLRYALVGIGTLLFGITAVSTWLPEFYRRQLHLSQAKADLYFNLLVVIAGPAAILVGGWLADRFATAVKGARVALPAYYILGGNTLFFISYLHLPFAPAYALEMVGLFVMALSVPALRAGLSDAVPAHLRGTGFGAFNLISVLFGTAAAPFVVSIFAQVFGGNLRTAFMIVTPPIFIGAVVLLRARNHLDEDTAKIFQAILTAAQAEQERQATRAAEFAARREEREREAAEA
ncbi:MAG TPA: MFS transporter [Acidimicrobiales bacterium]|nr:MFS transporter [Acidimicrobiales bacterium]